jgi:HTH-type transcriptional regulator / antitoxin HigA
MTITFNVDRYKDLLSEYQPKLIKTEQENEQALKVIEKLMHLPERTPEQNELFDTLRAKAAEILEQPIFGLSKA